jgi:hypothetical protein
VSRSLVDRAVAGRSVCFSWAFVMAYSVSAVVARPVRGFASDHGLGRACEWACARPTFFVTRMLANLAHRLGDGIPVVLAAGGVELLQP